MSERDFLQEKLIFFGEIVCLWNITIEIECNQIIELLLNRSLANAHLLNSISR
ncbi:MAG: hypothetical protein HZB10_01455 [Candidatus Yonathbacteria bacterium]|nr:hypothetical protein [Candidatus Yonathbacteria bacterium]